MSTTSTPLLNDFPEPYAPEGGRSAGAANGGTERHLELDQLLTATETAAILGIGRSKLYELLARGAIQSVKLDRCRRFRRSDLDRYIRSLPVAPASAALSTD